ncbi:MAG: DegV family protein [Lachnospiraceae bacterium]|jgi:DegV family protein with EDD domain
MIKIIADSTCDLSPELIEQHDISIIPLHILLDEEEYLDGVNIGPDEIFKWADENNTTPKTSAPALPDAMEIMEPFLKDDGEVIVFTISETMSATIKVVELAAENLNAADRVTCIESANLSTGIGLLVLAAADMVKEGKSRQEIVTEIETLKPRVRTSFVLDTLIYLHRGGRCSGVAALAGAALKIHPKIVVKNGSMEASKKYRGKMKFVIMDYVKDMEEDILQANPKRIFITHSGVEEETLKEIREYLQGMGRFEEILLTRAGGVISSHCGPGCIGVFFIAGN